ncbi:SIR2 family protein [Peribacillus sp. R9-11]|uniref:SIR2 family protein n=1 Tax=Peribacillus sp. R9-11 TaxID=3073271 RepID=UPI0028688018|nr:SIR2 family protein [Peribacillus sp. R9-11]WMX58096.1 SIR2 family protein [Peribacillus sp. R9-11]
MKFGILVGNGFTTDFVSQYKMDSSLPIRNFKNRHVKKRYGFIKKLPAIQTDLLTIKNRDYNAISKYIVRNKNDVTKLHQLKTFLALSYSAFQEQVDLFDMTEWKWSNWLQQNREGLSCAVSLNYDLVLEKALNIADIPYSRVGSDENPIGTPIYKPHGSIDFDLSSKFISIPFEGRWPPNLIHNNDGGIVTVIPKEDFHQPRVQADIVPPSMHNINQNLRWVRGLYNNYLEKASQLDAFVIIGSSYWEVDRPEINFFLEKLPQTAKVYISNPEPDRDLVKKIRSLGLPYKTFGFNELPW